MSELSVNPNALTREAVQASADQQLMIRLARRDESAMRELIDQHGEAVSLLIGRLTGWSSDQDDILQDVLLVVWQKANHFRGEGSLEGWLKRMAINRCRNHFRAANSVKRLIERFANLVQPKDVTQPTEPQTDPEPNQQLRVALQSLSQSDRTALVLFYLEEMPSEEVAQILNIKLETLHVRLHRARKKLKQEMEKTNVV